MMYEQDQEEDEDCSWAAPYSTMPTLLQLQAMRNKLSVAYLGRELMKWNSSSTEIELKKISVDLHRVYKNFARDLSEAYLLLARCKYYNQDFYRTVTESVKTASVHVFSTRKNVAGVNIVSYSAKLVGNQKQHGPFLSRGGQTIQEAKKAWSKLLRSHIKMVELRTNFLLIEAAYRNATKRQNIINQIVVPKTQATINYIIVELEETKREESHRMKMKLSKIKKFRDTKSVRAHNEISRIEEADGIYKSFPPSSSLIEEQSEPINEQKYQPILLFNDMSETNKGRSIIKLNSQQLIPSLKNFYELVCLGSGSKRLYSKKRLSVGDRDARLDLRMTDKATLAIDGFLEICIDTRSHLDSLINNEKLCSVDSKLINNLDHLKSHIDAVIHFNSKLQNAAVLAPSVKNFIQCCGRIDLALKIAIKDIDHTPLDESGKKRVYNLIKNINDVVKIITEYKTEGLLTPSLEEFSRVCNEAKEKIGANVKNPSHKKQNFEYFKKMVADIEKLTADIIREGMDSASIKLFLSSCKEFKMKLENYKKHEPKFSRRANDVVEREESLSESIQKFMTSCEDFIKRAQYYKDRTRNIANSKNVSKVSELMTEWEKQGLLNKSTIEFMSNAKTRWTLDSLMNPDTNSSGHFILSPKEESLEISDENTNKYLTTPIKTRNLTNNHIFPPIHGDVCCSQTEDCELLQPTNNTPPVRAKLAKKSIITSKKFKKSAAGDIEDRSKSSNKIECSEEKTPYPIVKDAEIYAQTHCCKFQNKTCVRSFTESDDGKEPSQGQSEIIVAEISAYDSCPVFEPKNSNIWLLETRCFDENDTLASVTQDSSEQTVKNEACYVRDKENPPDEFAVKKTYTM